MILYKVSYVAFVNVFLLVSEEADTDVSNEPQVCSGSHKTEAKQSSSFALQRMLTTVVDKVLVFHEAAQTHLPTKDGVLAATGASKASCESGGENPQADTDMLITNSLFSSMTSDQWKCSVVLREPSAGKPCGVSIVRLHKKVWARNCALTLRELAV